MVIVSELLCTSNKSDIAKNVVSVVNEKQFTDNGLLFFFKFIITLVIEFILNDEVDAMYSSSLVRYNDKLSLKDKQTL